MNYFEVPFSHTMQSGDTLSSIAADLAAQVNSNQFLQAFGMTATASSNVLSITSPGVRDADYYDTGSGAVTLSFSSQNPDQYAGFYGSASTSDVVTLTVHDSGLSGGSKSVSYTVQAGDNLMAVSQKLSLAVNSDTNLQSIGVSSVWGLYPNYFNLPVVYLISDSSNTTTYTISTTGTENPSILTSPLGTVQQTQTIRNSLGNVTSLVDPIGRQFTYTYASNNMDLLAITDFAGSPIGQWAYGNPSAPHRPTSYINGSGQTTQYSYNTPYSELATITDPNSNVTTLSYDSSGYLTQIQGPLSGSQDVTSFSFFGYGLPHTVTDSEGYELVYGYDALNRPTSTTYPDGSSEQTIYDKLDPILSCDRLGRWTKRCYDAIDQLACEQDPLINGSSRQHDHMAA
jgi:YD repeat-containing protein